MKDNEIHYASVFATDIATIGLLFDGDELIKVAYLDGGLQQASDSKLAEKVRSEIEKFIDSKSAVKDIRVSISLHVTAFQKTVLQELQKIPYGETRTYGEIAKILNTSPRAVGNACRNNPLPLVIPCHRVVAANSIGGYDGAKSGSLLAIKKRLLENEGVYYTVTPAQH